MSIQKKAANTLLDTHIYANLTKQLDTQSKALDAARENGVIKNFFFDEKLMENLKKHLDSLRMENFNSYIDAYEIINNVFVSEEEKKNQIFKKTEFADEDFDAIFAFMLAMLKYQSLIVNSTDVKTIRKCEQFKSSFKEFLKRKYYNCQSALKSGIDVKMVKSRLLALQCGLNQIKLAASDEDTKKFLNELSQMMVKRLFEADDMTKMLENLIGLENQRDLPEKLNWNDDTDDNAGGLDGVLKRIRFQLDTAVEKVRDLMDQEDYSIIQLGIRNIFHLSKFHKLKEPSDTAELKIKSFLKERSNQLIENFKQEFGRRNFLTIDTIIAKAAAVDKGILQNIGIPNYLDPLMHQIEDAFNKELELLIQRNSGPSQSLDDHADTIIEIKRFVAEISNTNIQSLAASKIVSYLEDLGKSKKNFFKLGSILTQKGALGQEVTEQHGQFKAVLTERFNKSTAHISLNHTLDSLSERNPSIPNEYIVELKRLAEHFEVLYESNLSKYLNGYKGYTTLPLLDLASTVKQKASKVSNSFLSTDLVELLAGIFAYWTISSSQDMFLDTQNADCLIKPHPVQLIAILRLLGLGSNVGIWKTFVAWTGFSSLPGHLIQVGTGEGKSILLGGLSCLLALLGYEVSCASYSKHLSKRDYEAFRSLFEAFSVHDKIYYSTLNNLVESVINRDGDVRKNVENAMLKGGKATAAVPKGSAVKRVLLMDEVDVFFSDDFYGETYDPIMEYSSVDTNAIFCAIWNNRATGITISKIKEMAEYNKLKEAFSPEASPLIDEHIRSMIMEVNNFNDPPYNVVKCDDGKTERIGYKTLDTVSTTVKYGYRTAFAYLNEVDSHPLMQSQVPAALSIQIPCGKYSYAEIPHSRFDCIMGVTGTLSCLSQEERNIIADDYKITDMTITPSIYGDSKLDFKMDRDVILEMDYPRYHQSILKEILNERNKGRPVVVFFENETELNRYESSDYGKSGLGNYNVVTELTENIPFFVNKATSPGTVTLFPKVFGRGLDFVVRDPTVDTVCGMHVIQTFFSDYLSEEIQTRGRTGRQSKNGSFKLILLAESLKKFRLTDQEIQDGMKLATFYEVLSKKREEFVTNHILGLKEKAKLAKRDHLTSENFLKALRSSNPNLSKLIPTMISFQPAGQSKYLHVIFCLDESGSMEDSWDALLSAVGQFLQIRKDKG